MAETSGSCSVVARKPSDYGKYNPIQRAAEKAKIRREIKDLKKVDKIESKPPEERTIEEKIFLANYYAEKVVGNIGKMTRPDIGLLA